MAKATAPAYDFNSLTMREISQIEKLSGQGLSSLSDDDRPKGLVLAAIAFTFRLRENPAYTWNEAQDLTLKEISEITAALGDLNVSEGPELDDASEPEALPVAA
ncbi:hypothetical protein [Microbacterium sp. NPDC087589]|uniref:hypothetical protein n=1 Tax=Microbacterium sp. NPDC087589 TaxID=3364191 RepID=UPI0038212902